VKDFTKILITGATGFIGSHLTRKLVEAGFEVGIIKRQNSNTWRINDLLAKLKVYEVDLRDTQKVSEAVSAFRPDAIFHLATYYAVKHRPKEIPLMVETNVLGAINLLEAANKSSLKLFINTSSCFVYRESKNKLKENDELNSLNLYALTKIQAEQACSFYAERFGLKAITLRLFPPYGPADHNRRLIPYAINSLLSGESLKMTTGKQQWDFTYVADIVEAYFRLLKSPKLPEKHEIFNVGTGNAVPVREVISQINKIMAGKLEPEWGVIPHRENEVWFTCADTTKTRNFLKWEPKTKIEDGLNNTVEWYKNFLGKEGVKNG